MHNTVSFYHAALEWPLMHVFGADTSVMSSQKLWNAFFLLLLAPALHPGLLTGVLVFLYSSFMVPLLACDILLKGVVLLACLQLYGWGALDSSPDAGVLLFWPW